MTFSRKFTGGLALAVGLTLGVANAQNGSNYHVLSNQAEAAFIGIGAGGTQVAAVDGIGTFVPGEDMRGSVQVDFGAFGGVQFSYRQPQFRETMCVFSVPPSGTTALQFPGLIFIELDGLNGNDPDIWTNPICAFNLPSFIPYGVGPNSSASFVLSGVPSGLAVTGFPTSATILLPNNGLVPTSEPGTATILAAAGGINLVVATGGSSAGLGCWLVQFTWTPSAVTFLDDIDGFWHYALNGQDGNQYWLMSTDDMNIWQSFSVLTDAGATALIGLIAAADYEFTMLSTEPVTAAALAPHGIAQNGPWYGWTENMGLDLAGNGGYDIGRGSHAVSMTGLEGVGSAFGTVNQDPANGPGGTTPSLAFITWDNNQKVTGATVNRNHVVWLDIDYPMINNFVFPFVPPADPALDPGVLKTDPNPTGIGNVIPSNNAASNKIRLPIHATGFIQGVTNLGLQTFFHTTKPAPSGWPDPSGVASGVFGVPAVGGGSLNLALPTFATSVPCGVGIPLNVTYGTSSLDTVPPQLKYSRDRFPVSGSRQLFLFD